MCTSCMQQMLWTNLAAVNFYSDVNEAFSNPAYGEVIGEYIPSVAWKNLYLHSDCSYCWYFPTTQRLATRVHLPIQCTAVLTLQMMVGWFFVVGNLMQAHPMLFMCHSVIWDYSIIWSSFLSLHRRKYLCWDLNSEVMFIYNDISYTGLVAQLDLIRLDQHMQL